MHHWQPTLVRVEHLRGIPGEVGATFRLVHRAGKCELELIETITRRDWPCALEVTQEMPGVSSRIAHRFDELAGGRTRWSVESEYRCRGLMQLAAWLMPRLFKRQTEQAMQRFKRFAEDCGTRMDVGEQSP